MSYSFINTFDYKNAAGAKSYSAPLYAIQVAPGVKFVANTKNGWQPYLSANAVMNFMDKTNILADNVSLPQMSIMPFVQYGVGIQKMFKDNFMAFGSTMLQSGGRNGITLNLGLRWAFGLDHHTDLVKLPAIHKFELLPDIEYKPATEPVRTKEVVTNVIDIQVSGNVVNIRNNKADDDDVVELTEPEGFDKGPLVLRIVEY